MIPTLPSTQFWAIFLVTLLEPVSSTRFSSLLRAEFRLVLALAIELLPVGGARFELVFLGANSLFESLTAPVSVVLS